MVVVVLLGFVLSVWLVRVLVVVCLFVVVFLTVLLTSTTEIATGNARPARIPETQTITIIESCTGSCCNQDHTRRSRRGNEGHLDKGEGRLVKETVPDTCITDMQCAQIPGHKERACIQAAEEAIAGSTERKAMKMDMASLARRVPWLQFV